MNGLNSGRMQWEMYRLELVQESYVPFHLLMASYVSIYSVFIERYREIYFSKGGFHNVSWRVHDSSIGRSVAEDEFLEYRSFNNVEKLDHVKITAFWTQGVALMLPLFESCGEGGALMSHYS